ncbi:MAG TPA: endo alpha-1,4 polygalactosaminidase, partial [Polyangiales bacterium]|nr:endo alpha-1,4 polygalactosaminidase [Polyangiales bacterium]
RFDELSERSLNEQVGFKQLRETTTLLQVSYEEQHFTNPLYCSGFTEKGYPIFSALDGTVPGAIELDGEPGTLTNVMADLNGDGLSESDFHATPSDWGSIVFSDAAPTIGVNRALQPTLTPCPPAHDVIIDDSPKVPAAGEGAMPADPTLPAGVTNGSSRVGAATGPVTLPPATGGFDYQLAGRYQADSRVRIVSSNADIAADGSGGGQNDLDTSRYNICYLNALQTQVSDNDYWLTAQPDLILVDSAGNPVHDPDPEWQGEMLFDIRSAEKRTRLIALQRAWLEGCRQAGFQAVEPDNLDAYTRSLGALTAEHAQSYMQLFVAEAHALGLAVAQKNAADWVSTRGADGATRAQSVGFDFAIIEECQLTGECEAVTSYYGPGRVFEIEYVYDS